MNENFNSYLEIYIFERVQVGIRICATPCDPFLDLPLTPEPVAARLSEQRLYTPGIRGMYVHLLVFESSVSSNGPLCRVVSLVLPPPDYLPPALAAASRLYLAPEARLTSRPAALVPMEPVRL